MPVMPAKAGDGGLPRYAVPIRKRKRKVRFWYLCLGRVLVYETPMKKLLPELKERSLMETQGRVQCLWKSLENADGIR